MGALVGPRGLESFLAPKPVDQVSVGFVMGLTENASATYLASGSACLDFFFHIVPDSPSERVVDLLEQAWKEDALTALKLVFHLRGVRGSGKSDKFHFYDAAYWMYKNHPRTLIANVDKVAPVGYFKDLLELLRRIVEGVEETSKRMKGQEERKRTKDCRRTLMPFQQADSEDADEHGTEDDAEDADEHGTEDVDQDADGTDHGDAVSSFLVPGELKPIKFKKARTTGYYSRKGAAARAAKEAGTLKPREERIAESLERDRRLKEEAAEQRKIKTLLLASQAVEKYETDEHYRSLYDAVTKLFGDKLAADLKALESTGNKDYARLSLAAKWCPSLDSSYDKRTLLCEGIARYMFPKSSTSEYEHLSHEEYTYRVWNKLRTQVLVPLREALKLPEVYMSAQRWSELPYERVASVAMSLYKKHFEKHDQERFSAYLKKVEEGKAKIAAGAVLPHEILRSAVKDEGDQAMVAELQWRRMVDDLKAKGTLTSSLSVCDVSGSMSGTPMEVCIALGLLTSELNEEPWKDHLITFSETPQLHLVQGSTLKEKHLFAANMDWGSNTDFQKVFDGILERAKQCQLPPERMVKRLFVFSDMEFDYARGAHVYGLEQPMPWDTDYEVICQKFEEAGYGRPPQIVFWNLRDSQSIPVTKDQPGVALVSGFSKNLLKLFLDNDGDIDPMLVMQQAIAGDIYNDMKVVD